MRVGDMVRMVAPYYNDVPRGSMGLVIESYTDGVTPMQLVMFPVLTEWFIGGIWRHYEPR